MKGKGSYCVENFATFVPKGIFLNGCNREAVKLSEVCTRLILKSHVLLQT